VVGCGWLRLLGNQRQGWSLRTSSVSAAMASATPKASSSPAHGRLAKAWPPSRPMKNA
jgi:hypothetical protein